MSKQLINIVGIVVVLAVMVAGVLLIAVPFVGQAIAAAEAAASVGQTNALYETQVAALETEADRIDEINASVDDLRTQIPATNRLDEVFELVAQAAAATGVTVVSVTAGEPASFVPRTAPVDTSEPAAAVEPAPDATVNDAADAESGASSEPTDVSPTEETEVPFVIVVNATDPGSATAFLDALRGGPRLLSSLQSTLVAEGLEGLRLQVSANTFVDAE